MITIYQAYTNIGKTRLYGDVVKENHHTVWMVIYPPEKLKWDMMKKHGAILKEIGPIKRHKRKHKVSRIA